MSNRARLLLVALTLGLGLGASWALFAVARPVRTGTAEIPPPLVRVVHAELGDTRVRIRTQGTVAPRTQTNLVAEAAGRVVRISPALADGGFFEAGEELVGIESRPYEIAVAQAEATVARLASEAHLAEAKLARVAALHEKGVASIAQLEEARNAHQVADAAHRKARAELTQARWNLERTRILAPFTGRVREKRVDVGQYVTPGVPVARVYAVDYAEVRLPVAYDDLAFIDLPRRRFDGAVPRALPPVRILGGSAGRRHEWQGRIVRAEGAIDPHTRMLHVVARVDDPFRAQGDVPTLTVGEFVDAEIAGRRLEDVFVLPRSALRGGQRVLVVTDEERLEYRDVQVVREDREQAVVRDGLSDGERVCVSPLPIAVDGMKVRTTRADSTRQSAETSRAGDAL